MPSGRPNTALVTRQLLNQLAPVSPLNASASRLRNTRKLFQISSPKTAGINMTTLSMNMML